MDQALSLVQRRHLSLQSMHTWLDSAASVLQRASSGVELDNQTDCVRYLEEISAQEKNFTAGVEELRSLDPLLEDFVEAGAMSELREKVEAIQLRKTEVKQQLDAYREVLQRCVLVLMWSQVTYICTAGMCSPCDEYFKNKLSSIVVCMLFFCLSYAALWTSFQHEKGTLVEQMYDAESKMAMVTTAKAVGIQHAEEKCHRYKVGYCLTLINHRECRKRLSDVYRHCLTCMCCVPCGCYVILNSNICCHSWS